MTDPVVVSSSPAPATAPPPAAPAAPPSRPNAAEWLGMSPDARAEWSRTQNNPLDPARVVQMRDPTTGNIVTKDRTTGAVIDGPADATAAPGGDIPSADGDRVKIGDVEMTAKEWTEAATFKAEQDLLRAQVPAAPSDYKLDLDAAKLPAGMTVEFDMSNPTTAASIEAAQNWAHANKFSQTQFNDMMTLYASVQANETLAFSQAQAREMQALGANGPQRIDAVARWLNSNFGSVATKPIIATLATHHHVETFEKIIHKLTSQGSAPFDARHRDVDDGRVSEEVYNSWSYSEKKAYAESRSAGGPGHRRR